MNERLQPRRDEQRPDDEAETVQGPVGSRATASLSAALMPHQLKRPGGDESAAATARSGGAKAERQHRELREARQALLIASWTIWLEQAGIDYHYREHGRRLFDHARETVGRVTDFERSADRHGLEKLRDDLLEDLGDQIAGGVVVWTLPALVLGLGLDAYRRYETGETVDEQVALSDVRAELATELGGSTFDLVADLMLTQESPLYRLANRREEGAALRGAIEQEIGDLAFDLQTTEQGGTLKRRRLDHQLSQVEGLLQRHEEWSRANEEAVRRASRAVAEVPDRLRHAYGRMLDRYATSGGTTPRGPHRAELARFRLEEALRGRPATVVARERERRLLVDGRTYRIAPPGHRFARPGQAAEVVGVELLSMFRGRGGAPDERQTETVERWYPNMFVVEVELGSFPTVVPHVRGLPVDQAMGRVVQAGLEPVVSYRSSELASGITLGIRPAPGTELVSDREVVVLVSK